MSDVVKLPVKFDPRQFRLNIGGLAGSVWRHDLVEGQSFEDCLDYNSYSRVMAANAAPQKKDRIEVWSFDGESLVEFIVLDVNKAWLKLRPIGSSTAKEVEAPDASPLAVKWNVGARTWTVIRKSDNAVLRAGLTLKADAVAWIADHLKQMAA